MVILCYQLSDHESHVLHQERAHDPLLTDSFSTFTQLYLKDVAWADSELYHLGPVVAAQQIPL